MSSLLELTKLLHSGKDPWRVCELCAEDVECAVVTALFPTPTPALVRTLSFAMVGATSMGAVNPFLLSELSLSGCAIGAMGAPLEPRTFCTPIEPQQDVADGGATKVEVRTRATPATMSVLAVQVLMNYLEMRAILLIRTMRASTISDVDTVWAKGMLLDSLRVEQLKSDRRPDMDGIITTIESVVYRACKWWTNEHRAFECAPKMLILYIFRLIRVACQVENRHPVYLRGAGSVLSVILNSGIGSHDMMFVNAAVTFAVLVIKFRLHVSASVMSLASEVGHRAFISALLRCCPILEELEQRGVIMDVIVGILTNMPPCLPLLSAHGSTVDTAFPVECCFIRTCDEATESNRVDLNHYPTFVAKAIRFLAAHSAHSPRRRVLNLTHHTVTSLILCLRSRCTHPPPDVTMAFRRFVTASTTNRMDFKSYDKVLDDSDRAAWWWVLASKVTPVRREPPSSATTATDALNSHPIIGDGGVHFAETGDSEKLRLESVVRCEFTSTELKNPFTNLPVAWDDFSRTNTDTLRLETFYS